MNESEQLLQSMFRAAIAEKVLSGLDNIARCIAAVSVNKPDKEKAQTYDQFEKLINSELPNLVAHYCQELEAKLKEKGIDHAPR